MMGFFALLLTNTALAYFCFFMMSLFVIPLLTNILRKGTNRVLRWKDNSNQLYAAIVVLTLFLGFYFLASVKALLYVGFIPLVVWALLKFHNQNRGKKNV